MNLQESIRNDLDKITENALPKGVAKVNDPSIKAVGGTSLVGHYEFDYSTIVNTFGNPSKGDGYKVDAEWVIELDDGDVVTIYNYKDGQNYHGSDGLPVEDITNWHFGASRGGSHKSYNNPWRLYNVLQVVQLLDRTEQRMSN